MSTRSTSSATQRPQLGDKQKSSGWAWPRLVRAEAQKSSASTQLSTDTDTRIDANPKPSSTPNSEFEGMPSASETPQAVQAVQVVQAVPNPSTTPPPIGADHSGTSSPKTLSLREDKSHPTETAKASSRFTDPSSSQETVILEGSSTPSPKILQCEAAKKPQVHEPGAAYRSERTSVAEAARRLESMDQGSNPTTRRSPGSDQGLHSALPGVPFTLDQIMALPRPGKKYHSSGPDESNEEARPPVSLHRDIAARNESSPLPSEVTGHDVDESTSILPKSGATGGVAPSQNIGVEPSQGSSREDLHNPVEESHLSNSSDAEVQASVSEQEPLVASLSDTEKMPMGKHRDPETEPNPFQPVSNENTAESEVPPAEHDETTPLEKNHSFFRRFSRSNGHKTHAQKKEEQKKEVKEQSASVGNATAEADHDQPSRKGSTLPDQSILSLDVETPSIRKEATNNGKDRTPLGSHHGHHEHGTHHQAQDPPLEGYPYTLPPPESGRETGSPDSAPETSALSRFFRRNTTSKEPSCVAPPLPPRNPQNSTASNETIVLPQPPDSIPSHVPLSIGSPKIVIIRATSESCETVGGPDNVAAAENAHPKPRTSNLPSPVEDPFEDPTESGEPDAATTQIPSRATQSSTGTALLSEDLGKIEVPVQGMIPAGTKFIRKARCVVLGGPVLTILLGRELAKQTRPVLKLMAHGVAVQTNADGELELQPSSTVPTTIFDVKPAVSTGAKDKTTEAKGQTVDTNDGTIEANDETMVLPDGRSESPDEIWRANTHDERMRRDIDLREGRIRRAGQRQFLQNIDAGGNAGPRRMGRGYKDHINEHPGLRIAYDALLIDPDSGNV